MRHGLCVVLVTLTLASPAIAEVKISGMVSGGPFYAWSTDGVLGATNFVTETNNQDADRVKKGFSRQGITSNNSRVNIIAELPVKAWLKVLFKYELDIGDTGAPLSSIGSPWFNTGLMRTRDSYLGLGGWWGAVKWGTNQNVYERYLYEADPLDYATGIGGNLQMFGTPGYGIVYSAGQWWADPQRARAGFYRRTDQNIWYESPDIKGFSFEVAYALNGYQQDSEEYPYKPQVLSVGAQYKPMHLPFYVNIAYESHQDLFGLNLVANYPNAGTASKDVGLKAQAGVRIRFLTLGGIVEHLKYTVENGQSMSEYSRVAIGLHAKVDLPFGYIGIGAGQALNGKYKAPPTPEGGEVSGTAEDSGARYVGLGYFHRLSEHALLQFMGTIMQNQDNASYALPGQANCLPVAGASHRALYTGVRYDF